jgi:hypothetical protein
VTDSAEALDGLGRALWWLRDERGAVVDGELTRAARGALWLAREYGLAFTTMLPPVVGSHGACHVADPNEPQDRSDGAMTDDCRGGVLVGIMAV